jgi:glycosyltransferase involved in cell wall biosynthesis
MKILHLSSEQSWRGGEQQIAYLIEALDEMGFKPMVACKPSSEFEALCHRKKWTHYPLAMRSSTDIFSGLRLKKLCRQLSIDLVHAHTSHGHGTAFLAYLLGNKTPVLLTRRVDFEIGGTWLSKYKYNFPKLKKIACVSEAIRKIVNRGINSPEATTTIYSSIDHEKFEAHLGSDFLRQHFHLPPTTRLIGNTSAIVPHKDYFTFVDAAEFYIRHFERDVRFFVIGEGEQEDELKAYIHQRQLEEYFIFTGFLDNIEQVLPSLDVFLMTSKTEGLGTSVIDAFAAKVPVVATEAGGIPELVRPDETGFLSEIGDFRSLAQHLAKLKNEPETRDRLTANAYRRALELNVQSMAERYLTVYNEILSEKHN